MESVMDSNQKALEDRITALEKACKVTAESLASQMTTEIKDFSATLKDLRETQVKQGIRLHTLE